MIPEFRAWHKLQKRMLPVMCIDFAGSDISKGYPCIVAYPDDGCYNLKNVELMMFTGRLDKNNNKIFECDILESLKTGFRYIVKWEGTKACFVAYGAGESYITGWDKTIIIGNVFENPELLSDK
jgi:uncharacterized phage protein (TIGR01671 family)